MDIINLSVLIIELCFAFLYSKGTSKEIQSISSSRHFHVKDTRASTIAHTHSLTTILGSISNKNAYTVSSNYNSSGAMTAFTATFKASELTQSYVNLDKAKTDFSSFITNIQVDNAKRHMLQLSMIEFLPKNNGYYQTLRDYYKNKATTKYIVVIKCIITTPQQCLILAEVNNGI